MAGTAGQGSAAAETGIARLKAEVARLRSENEQLREREGMYRFSAELSRRLVWTTDADGKVLAISPLFLPLVGISDEEALKKGWIQAVHPEDRDRVEARWKQCLASGEPFEMEFRGMLADGSSRIALSRAVAVRDGDKRISRWLGVTQDIQDRKEAERARRDTEEKLRESEALHRHAVELSRQIVWTADASGAMVSMSDRFEEMTGEPVKASLGDGWQAFLHPGDRQRVVEKWREALREGSRLYVEFRIRGADGNYRFCCCRTAPKRNEAGQVTSWVGSVEDIDERKRAEIARHEAEERYRLAAKATQDAIWDYDIASGEVNWSEAAADVLGWPDIGGRTTVSWWESRIHPEDKLKVLRGWADAAATRRARWSAAYRFRRADGSYADLLDRGSINRDEKGAPVRAVGAIADLTERRRAEAELQRMQSELFHVSRVSAMGTMASTLAHELNQPLTAVSNYVRGARRLVERTGSDAALREALEAAEAGALRAGQIVYRLREFVSRGTVAIAVEHLPKLIEEASVLAFLDEGQQRIRHRVELDPRAQWVRADRIQIQQVLVNLIRNAVDAMRDSPVREVVVTTRLADDETVTVSVADTGCGIPPDKMDSLFSQFMTTKKEGMGIGLPISRTIVEAHGGHIRAENREEGGAVFSFTLPRARR